MSQSIEPRSAGHRRSQAIVTAVPLAVTISMLPFCPTVS